MAKYAAGGNMTDQEYNKIIEETSLFNAVINVTDNCNLRCPYCFTEHNTRIIDLGTMKSAIMFIINQYENKKHNLKTNRKPGFTFFGGEPMLHFEDIIKPTVLWTEESGLRDKY
jgi:sulfatase maturation enzyme AslB (radical SAM superfamily)